MIERLLMLAGAYALLAGAPTFALVCKDEIGVVEFMKAIEKRNNNGVLVALTLWAIGFGQK